MSIRSASRIFVWLGLLCLLNGAGAAEFEITADSFTVANQVNVSSVAYFQARSVAPPNPALATQFLTPGGLYFDATYYKVWDRTSLAWVKLATGTVELGRVAKTGDFMTGPLTLTGASGNVVSAASVTASGIFGDGAGLTSLSAANIAAGTAGISVTGNAATATNATNHIADVTGAVHGATNLNTANKIVRRDASGNFTAGTITAALSGNATTATNATNHIADVTGAVHGATSLSTANMIVRRNASGNFSVSDPINNTDAVNKQWVLANAGRPQYMGLTAVHNGAMGGPLGANALCNAAYSGSHFCRQSEILASGITAVGSGWVLPEGVGYEGAVNTYYVITLTGAVQSGSEVTCSAWTNAAAGVVGTVITVSGYVYTSNCNSSFGLTCCK